MIVYNEFGRSSIVLDIYANQNTFHQGTSLPTKHWCFTKEDWWEPFFWQDERYNGYFSCSSNTIPERERDSASRRSHYAIRQMVTWQISRFILDKVRIPSFVLLLTALFIEGTDAWAENFPDVKSLSVSEKIVVHLVGDLLGKQYSVYADNWFLSGRLARWLLNHQTTITGTVKKNRGEKLHLLLVCDYWCQCTLKTIDVYVYVYVYTYVDFLNQSATTLWKGKEDRWSQRITENQFSQCFYRNHPTEHIVYSFQLHRWASHAWHFWPIRTREYRSEIDIESILESEWDKYKVHGSQS